MKRLMLTGSWVSRLGLGVVLLFCFLLVALPSSAQISKTYSSSVLSASAVRSKIPCLVTGVTILTDGTNDATLILYDNTTTNSGTILYKVIVPGAAKSRDAQFTVPVKALLGVYMSLSGTGANAIIYTTPE